MLAGLYAEINIFCILVVFLILHRVVNGVETKYRQHMLLHMLAGAVLSFAFDLLWVFSDTGVIKIPREVNYLINICYFLSAGALTYFWYRYAEDIMQQKAQKKKINKVIARIPIAAYAGILITTYWTGWMFYITEDGSYSRGNLFLLQMIIAYGYSVFITLKSLFLALNKKNWAKRSQYLTLLQFAAFPLIFGIMQIVVPGVPLISAGITLAILCFYLNYLEQQISLDALTQLNNRRQLINYLENKVRHSDKEHTLYLLMVDMDYFKSINDKYGHVEGDRALIRVANILRQASRNLNCFLSRYGGDEFTIVYETENPEEVEAYCGKIRAFLYLANSTGQTPYQLSLSIGYAVYSREYRSLQDFIHAADKKLYQVKSERVKK